MGSFQSPVFYMRAQDHHVNKWYKKESTLTIILFRAGLCYSNPKAHHLMTLRDNCLCIQRRNERIRKINTIYLFMPTGRNVFLEWTKIIWRNTTEGSQEKIILGEDTEWSVNHVPGLTDWYGVLDGHLMQKDREPKLLRTCYWPRLSPRLCQFPKRSSPISGPIIHRPSTPSSVSHLWVVTFLWTPSIFCMCLLWDTHLYVRFNNVYTSHIFFLIINNLRSQVLIKYLGMNQLLNTD